MNKLLRTVGALRGGLAALVACVLAWASFTTNRLRTQTFQTQSVDLPIPFPIGRLLAPNLTLGTGSRTAEYKPRDWDRIVRHGVLTDGPAISS
jgi:predicted alpha/beta hydrolase